MSIMILSPLLSIVCAGLKHGEEPKSFGIALLAYLFVLRLHHHEIVPAKPWSLSELQHSLRLSVITNQVEHNVTVKLAHGYKAA